MAVHLAYATPQPASRPSPAIFWLLYAVCGFVSSFATDAVLHLWSGTPSDGGCIIVGIFSLIPVGVAVFIVRGLIGPRVKMWRWLGVLVGAMAPAAGLAT